MTAVAVGHPHQAGQSLSGPGNFAGTLRLLRLYLRRDRIVLPLWVLLLSLPLGSVYVQSIRKLYHTPAELGAFAHSILTSPAQLAMYGPIYNNTLGAAGLWKAGAFHTVIGIATILTVIRHTRAEEESGRAELLAATRLGRWSGLTAALLLACLGALAAGLIGAASIRGAGVPGNGALAFGLALAASGIVFAAVAAVAAQLSANARTTRGLAFTVLAVTFVLRALGDARAADGPASPLTWFAPQGWSLQVRPFAGDHWWVLLLHVIATAILVAAAYALLMRRDLGAGLLAQRPGSPAAGALLRGPFGLAWRLQRGSLVAWTVGVALYGLVFGSVVHGIGNELVDNNAAHDVLARLGGTQGIEDAFLAAAFAILGLMAAAYSVASALRLGSEETSQRGESVLAGSVSRLRWAASHLVYAFLGSAAMLIVSGLLAGLVYGVADGHVGHQLPRVLGAAVVQLPAVWVFTAITVLLFGLVPHWVTATWLVYVAGIALFLLGSVAGIPQWLLDISPWTHVPRLPAAAFSATPVVVLLLVVVALTAVGLWGLRRRDLR